MTTVIVTKNTFLHLADVNEDSWETQSCPGRLEHDQDFEDLLDFEDVTDIPKEDEPIVADDGSNIFLAGGKVGSSYGTVPCESVSYGTVPCSYGTVPYAPGPGFHASLVFVC